MMNFNVLKFFILLIGLVTLFNFQTSKSEANTLTTLTMDEDIRMRIHGVGPFDTIETKGELKTKRLKFVNVFDSNNFFIKESNNESINLPNGSYNIFDITEQGDNTNHDNLTPGSWVTVNNGTVTPANILFNYYTVTFYEDISTNSILSQSNVLAGNNISEPTAPSKDMYSFAGWVDKNGKPFNFNNRIYHATEVYAKWNELGKETLVWKIGDTIPHPTKGMVIPKYYRIPSVIVSARGTLIAAADMRYDTPNDNLGQIAIGVKRSEDGGQTWSETTIAVPMPLENNQPTSARARSMDTTILSAEDGNIYILAGAWKSNSTNWAATTTKTPDPDWAAYLVKSEDDGVTWEMVKKWDASNINELSTDPIVAFLGGVGSAIQMEDGTLVFPIDICLTNGTKNSVKATILYSKDNGQTWKLGNGYVDDVSENNVIETSHGTLLMNGRKDGSSSRAVYYSDDLGDTWKQHVLDKKITVRNPQTQGSFIKIELENGEEVALFSTPKNTSGTYERDNITLWATYDYMTWRELGTLYAPKGNPDGAGYSGLAGGLDENGEGYLYFIYEKDGNIAFRDISAYLTMINKQSTNYINSNISEKVN